MAPIIYYSNFVNNPDAAFARLIELDWEQREAPRQEYYCNDFNEPYVYGSGKGKRKNGTSGLEPMSKLKLEHGSLCLMAPGMQDEWQHRIPKASFQCGERIGLTFRGYVKCDIP